MKARLRTKSAHRLNPCRSAKRSPLKKVRRLSPLNLIPKRHILFCQEAPLPMHWAILPPNKVRRRKKSYFRCRHIYSNSYR